MKYLSLLLVFLFFYSSHLLAQFPQQDGPSITGRISGTVVDSITGKAVEFATIIVVDPQQDGKQVNGGITEPDGSFRLTEVKVGNYQMKISFLGYEEKVIDGIETTPARPDVDLGKVFLLPAGINLNEVTVTGQAALIENRIDKLVYNAEKDVTSSGGTAGDVLRKVPLLSVDLEGNVSLRGSNNVRILVNGRPSTIFASSPADALKTIPADQIKSVEVVTTPSAKYDGEGTAGIINIITKKKSVDGLTGSVNSSIGTRQNNAGLNLNWVRGRFGLNTGANSFWSWRRTGNFEFYREDNLGQPAVLQQSGPNATEFLGFNGNLGAFYDFNAYNSINISGRANGFSNRRDGTINGVFMPANDSAEIFDRFSEGSFLRSGFDVTADYRRTFPDSEREFTLAFQLSGEVSDQNDQSDQEGNVPRYQRDIINNNDGLSLEYTLQADYVHPFGEKIKMETGLKGVLRRIDSDYETLVKENDAGNFTPIPLLTDEFFYDQDVYAAYLSFNVKLGEKTGLVAGLRYEHTDIGGEFASDQPDFQQGYDNFLPSLILSQQFKNFQTLKLSYTRRIQRPSLFYINPYSSVSDPNFITFGNPDLLPELVDQVELGYNTFVKGIALNGALYYRRTSDIIESFVRVVDERSESTYLNIGLNNSVGFNFFSSLTLFKIWSLRAGFNIFTYDARSTVASIDLSRDAIMYTGNLGSTFSLPKDFKIELFGFFNSPRPTLQGENPSFSIFGAGLRKEFSKRFSVGVSAIEPFVENKSFATELEGENFYQRTNFTIPFRSIGVTLSYNFGKLDFNAQRRRRGSAIENDDLKSGEQQNF